MESTITPSEKVIKIPNPNEKKTLTTKVEVSANHKDSINWMIYKLFLRHVYLLTFK